MRADDFPYLRDLLGGYFHQDAFASGETVEEIVREFEGSSWEYQRLGVRADIQRLLHEHGTPSLLEDFNKAFEPSVIIGASDEEASAWLANVDALLASPGGDSRDGPRG